MYSELFCGTLEASTLNFHDENDDSQVKLFKIKISDYLDLVSYKRNILNSPECIRADNFHFEIDRNRFIVCRILLKVLLATHLTLDVSDINLEEDSNKKPYLPSHPTQFFNLTHSGDYALIALANNPIGVDIEYINKEFKYIEVMPIVFHMVELQEIQKSQAKHTTFYKFWTRKESIVKAIGRGIDDDLPKIPTIDGIHSIPKVLMGNYDQMTAFSFNVTDHYIGALAFTENKIDLEEILFHPLPTSDEIISVISVN